MNTVGKCNFEKTGPILNGQRSLSKPPCSPTSLLNPSTCSRRSSFEWSLHPVTQVSHTLALSQDAITMNPSPFLAQLFPFSLSVSGPRSAPRLLCLSKDHPRVPCHSLSNLPALSLSLTVLWAFSPRPF